MRTFANATIMLVFTIPENAKLQRLEVVQYLNTYVEIIHDP